MPVQIDMRRELSSIYQFDPVTYAAVRVSGLVSLTCCLCTESNMLGPVFSEDGSSFRFRGRRMSNGMLGKVAFSAA